MSELISLTWRGFETGLKMYLKLPGGIGNGDA
jgi:hypothetical protein